MHASWFHKYPYVVGSRLLGAFSSERNRVRKHNAEQREYKVLHLMPVLKFKDATSVCHMGMGMGMFGQ
jgi:hypothetical protein